MCSDDTCTAAVCFPLQAWCRTQNVRDETKPTWKPLRGNLLSSPATAMQTFLSDRSEVFPFFFFFFPFFFWFIGIEKKSSYGRWVFLVYLLKFLHFCAYVPNPQNESGKMLSEWTEWGSSFTSELSRLNNEGLRQPWYTASTSEVAALTREPEIRSLTIQMQCVAAVRGIRSLCNLPLLINLFLSILPHLHTTPHSESVGLSQQCCNEIVWSRALAKTLESIQEGELGS